MMVMGWMTAGGIACANTVVVINLFQLHHGCVRRSRRLLGIKAFCHQRLAAAEPNGPKPCEDGRTEIYCNLLAAESIGPLGDVTHPPAVVPQFADIGLECSFRLLNRRRTGQ